MNESQVLLNNADRLAQMFETQNLLQTETYHYNFQYMPLQERIAYIEKMYVAAVRELGEAHDETSWKPWATKQFANRDALIGELVDTWHFIMNMALAFGDDPLDLADEFFTRYQRKAALNAKRQVEGYDGVAGKCPDCRRALDDEGVGCYQKDNGRWICFNTAP